MGQVSRAMKLGQSLNFPLQMGGDPIMTLMSARRELG
jgi:hypothetical protein